MTYECAALYLRLSPRPDGSYDGIDEQERQGRAYAAQTWPGVQVRAFRDEGLSAARDDVVRPGYNALRAAVAAGDITRLWAVEQTRLERREVPWFTLAAELQAAGITEVHTRRDGIIRLDDVVGGLKAVLGAYEVRRLRDRVNDTLDARAAAGVPPGTRPFGYRANAKGAREQRTYVIIEEQAAAIRWAAARVLAGWSLSRIADHLDGQGLRGTHGGKITPVAVRRWLISPSIAGLRVHRGEILLDVKGNWPAILDEQTWREVNAVLAQPRVVRRRDGGTYPVTTAHTGPAGRHYLLTGGLAVCGVCGHAMTGAVKQLGKKPGQPPKRTAPYLLCHPSRGGRSCTGVMLDPVEQYVVARLFTELEQRPAWAAALSSDQHAGTRAELAAALAALHAERTAYARDAAAGEMTRSEWLAMKPVFDDRESKLRRDLASIPAPAGRADWQEVREAWADLELDEQRAFLRRYIAAVTINRARPGTQSFDPGRVSIEWREV